MNTVYWASEEIGQATYYPLRHGKLAMLGTGKEHWMIYAGMKEH